ncbi:MAG TPA: hypothetical protein VHZ78_15855 [Rhizomicrobium sp.]|nr:hypothetical protein [Rhizomicrobium sp.]
MGFSLNYWKGSFQTIVRFESEAEALWRACELFEDDTVWDLVLCGEEGQVLVYLSDFRSYAKSRARSFKAGRP